MTSAETLLACCVVGLACFIGGEAVGARHTVLDEAAGTIAAKVARTGGVARGTTDRRAPETGDVRRGTDGAAHARASVTRDEARLRIASGTSGTYIDELLVARDSAIARWPDRVTRPLRVYVREGEALESWHPDFTSAVRDAFDTWAQVGIPVRFTFVRDSSSADISVRFVDEFANGISGKTVWSRDDAHWLLSGDIQLAVAHPHGGSVTPPQMRAIALHEVGHLLGLDHTEHPDHIMAARVRVRDLSDADKATVRLVYSVPAGSVRR